MSFLFEIDDRSAEAAEFISHVRHELLKALAQEKDKYKKAGSKLTQQLLADKLDTHRSVINRILAGEANLTLRTVSDLAWALNRDISFALTDKIEQQLGNHSFGTSSELPRTSLLNCPQTASGAAGQVTLNINPSQDRRSVVTERHVVENAY